MKGTDDRTFGSGNRLAARRPSPTTGTGRGWGGFLLRQRGPHVLHVKLTGRLSPRTVEELHRRVRLARSTGDTTFILLDASHLQHIPLHVVQRLVRRESEWRRLQAVTLWIGLSSYLANLLVLAWSGDDMLPVFLDLRSAMRAVRAVGGTPPGIARGRLSAWGGMRH